MQGATTKSGTHLSVAWSQRHLAYSCLAHLHASLDLIDPDAPNEAVVQSVAHGFHILNRYCHAHGLKHLDLQQPHSVNIGEPDDPQLKMLQMQLFERYMYVQERLGLHDIAVTNYGTELNIVEVMSLVRGALQDISEMAEDHTLGECKIAARNKSRLTTIATPTKWPSLFCQVKARYNVIADNLLAPDAEMTYPFLDASTLHIFKLLYVNSGFRCRKPECRFGLDGFSTADARDAHERTHDLRLQCIERSCPFNSSIGFRTAKDLRNHNRKYHADKAEPVVALWARSRLARSGRSKQHTPSHYGHASQPKLLKHHSEDDPMTPGRLDRENIDRRIEDSGEQRIIDAPTQLMLLEQQNKKRLLMARMQLDSETLASTGGSGDTPEHFSLPPPPFMKFPIGGSRFDPDQSTAWEEVQVPRLSPSDTQPNGIGTTERALPDGQAHSMTSSQRLLDRRVEEQQEANSSGPGRLVDFQMHILHLQQREKKRELEKRRAQQKKEQNS